jgi:hypothetical protein
MPKKLNQLRREAARRTAGEGLAAKSAAALHSATRKKEGEAGTKIRARRAPRSSSRSRAVSLVARVDAGDIRAVHA